MKIILSIISLFIYSNVHAQHINKIYPWIANYNINHSIKHRFEPPPGYHRVNAATGSFADWLRSLPLKSGGAPVFDYLGRTKLAPDDTTLAAVVDYPVRGKKLEQCMDVLYRWYAEYLHADNFDEEIKFFMPGGYILSWDDWKNGLRPEYQGVTIHFKKTATPDSSRSVFEEYLHEVFYYSFTQTAYFAYPPVELADLKIGDFIVKKGSKGHAVMIMDMVADGNGNKLVLVGHGGTPAREFHLLNFKKNNPWFPIDTTSASIDLPIKKKMTWDGLRRFPHE